MLKTSAMTEDYCDECGALGEIAGFCGCGAQLCPDCIDEHATECPDWNAPEQEHDYYMED